MYKKNYFLLPLPPDTLEIVQISFSMLTLTTKIISTHQKNVTTSQIIEGDMEDSQRFRMPCFVQVRGRGRGRAAEADTQE